MSIYVRVAVNIAQLSGTFDYQLPPALQGRVQAGSLVTVPFGKQIAQGIVLNTIEEPSVPEIKEVSGLVVPLPVVSPLQILLAKNMAEQNLASLSEYLDLMLPPGLSQHVDTLVRLLPASAVEQGLTPLQLRIVALLQKNKEMRGRQLDAALPHVRWRESLTGLVKGGLVSTEPVLLPPSIHSRQIRTAALSLPEDGALRNLRGPTSGRKPTAAVLSRREAVLNLLAQEKGPVDVSMVYAETGANAADIHALAGMNLISLGEGEFWRDPLREMNLPLERVPVLTPGQAAVWQVLETQFAVGASPKLNLLVGVTGSGKTEIYLRAVEAALAQGKQAIVLVPEIALTPQTVRRFLARFPGKVALVHSRLSPGERYDTWRRIRSGALTVVVGARSALFAPVPNLGLIVIDECHDESYFQDDLHPHYSAVESALSYARVADVPLVMGSATPNVEQIYRARREKWHELRLPDRILAHGSQSADSPSDPGTLSLPPVQVVDMRTELKAGNRSVLSASLRQSLTQVLQQNEQAILFLNRRGSATYVFCRDCGYVVRCPRCGTQMTFHAQADVLLCHICGYRRQMPKKCPECGGPNIRQFGLGTESLEKTIVQEFSGARVLRWDADTSRFKGAHDLILDHFTQHRADILIGTKMLAKGLDLPLVTLVGVVLADVSLNLPDFRANERTFQILCQVAGRAGRSSKGGKVIFQTFHPEHYAIRYASLHDLDGFYEEELALRQKTDYPPFSRLLRIEFRAAQAASVEQAAGEIGDKFRQWIRPQHLEMIGPVPCFYSRMAGIYRWQILLRGRKFYPFLNEHPLNTWSPRNVQVELTADPPSVL
jgi:primosomal protein N' (replication factor Y)